MIFYSAHKAEIDALVEKTIIELLNERYEYRSEEQLAVSPTTSRPLMELPFYLSKNQLKFYYDNKLPDLLITNDSEINFKTGMVYPSLTQIGKICELSDPGIDNNLILYEKFLSEQFEQIISYTRFTSETKKFLNNQDIEYKKKFVLKFFTKRQNRLDLENVESENNTLLKKIFIQNKNKFLKNISNIEQIVTELVVKPIKLPR